MTTKPQAMLVKRVHAGTVVLIAMLALAATAAAPARAAAEEGQATFALHAADETGRVQLSGRAGSVLTSAVNVRNLTGHPISVVLQTAGIETASNGNANFVTRALTPAGRWLTLQSNLVRLAPFATTRIPFTVSVPRGTRGAYHFAGVVAFNEAELASTATPAARQSDETAAGTIRHLNREAVPVIVRLPGPVSRALALHTLAISVSPTGAGLTLGLLPGGSDLIEGATVDLRVLRNSRDLFGYSGTMGQLFPGSGLNYRIRWKGTPTPGSYQVVGWIRPEGAPAIYVDRVIPFTEAKAEKLKREAPAAPGPPPSGGIPWWVWLALTTAVMAVLALTVAVRKLSRRPPARAA